MFRISRKQQSAPRREKYQYFIDSPKYEVVDQRRIMFKGWIIPLNGKPLKGLRLQNGVQTIEIPYGLPRPDVGQAFPDYKDVSMRSGFELEFEFEDGTIDLEANTGSGYELVVRKEISYSGKRMKNKFFNPHMAVNWSIHKELLQQKSTYYSVPNDGRTYSRRASDPKLIAFYLPQFHPIPENDKAWGKGFTEWTNVTAAEPRFIGHQQPFLPKDLGFYDLRLPDITKQQIDLAKQYGIYGFCYYYYWFSGKKLLDTPLNILLDHKEWDFNFMICWANENWTKRWDGLDDDVIVRQRYLEDDPLRFIKDVEPILMDKRYIRIDDKPVLAVYRIKDLKDPKRYVRVWRDYFRKKHKTELHLVSSVGFESDDPTEYGFDAAIDFMPHGVNFKPGVFEGDTTPVTRVDKKLLDPEFEALVFDYRKIVTNHKLHDFQYPYPVYRCVMPSWDNDARRKGKGGVFFNNNPDLYAHWLDQAIAHSDGKPVFVNAWNEWGEGTVLEPSQHYDHAVLDATRSVLARHSTKENQKMFPRFGISKKSGTNIAVVIHLYYIDMWPQMKRYLKMLDDQKWDLFVNIRPQNAEFAETIRADYPGACISMLPNRGRDILPFMFTAKRLSVLGYKAVLKLHSKKSEYRKQGMFKTTGEDWFNDLMGKLLPSKKVVNEVIEKLTSEKAIIGPDGHYLSFGAFLGSNHSHIQKQLEMLYGVDKAREIITHADKYAHFAGSMFWASMSALDVLLDFSYMPEDFDQEAGQIDGTPAHAVERLFGVLGQLDGATSYSVNRRGLRKLDHAKDALKKYKYIT